jgi:hypothetical protein
MELGGITMLGVWSMYCPYKNYCELRGGKKNVAHIRILCGLGGKRILHCISYIFLWDLFSPVGR